MTTTATTATGVGSYPITASLGTLNATNYTFAFASGTLTVTPASLTVTANNASRVYGQANPTFADTIIGFINNDPASVVSGAASLTTAAGATSAPGSYVITAAQGTLAATNYTFAFVNGTLTVNQDATSTALSATTSGQSATLTATVTANSPGSGIPAGTVTFVDTTGQILGSGIALSSGGVATLSVAALPTGTQVVTATYSGNVDFLTSTGSVNLSPAASVLVLNATASGALTLSGNPNLTVAGTVVVDSSSANAIVASGNAVVHAAAIRDVGRYSASGNASFSPTPTTGVSAVADPLASLPIPSVSGTASAVNVSCNSSLTINPGLYTSIAVSGNGHLTMNSGIYVIEGGGLSVSGNGTLSAPNVLIYNAGTAYPSLGGCFGAITFSGNGSVTLSAPTTGTYAGISLFQSRDNTQSLSLSGNDYTGVTGSVYAANAQLVLSGNAHLNDALIVGTMNLSGNAEFNALGAGGGSGGSSSGGSGGGGPSGSSGLATAVVFTTSPQVFPAGQSSSVLTVALTDAAGNPALAGSGGVSFALSTSSATGTFLSPTGQPLATLTIPAGAGSASFTYEDAAPGVPTLTLSGVGVSATQQEVITGSAVGVLFTGSGQTLTAGQASQALTVQLEDADGNPTVAGATGLTLTLATSSTSGTFVDAQGNPITTVTIPAGSGTASFYYRDTAPGTAVLTVSTPSFTATQTELVLPPAVAYTPAQLLSAYGVTDLSLDGTGQTIAIVDAYNDPDIQQSVDVFDQQMSRIAGGATLYQEYGPASSFLTVLNQAGQPSPLPQTDPAGAGTTNWEVEEALDVEWIHAVAPGAKIVLVEAASQSLSDLMAGVVTAASQPGVSVVSLSWGFVEGQQVVAADEARYDADLRTPAGHQGVTFVASTGDYGAGFAEYPAFSPNVVAVGGTSLTLQGGSYAGETGWGYNASGPGTFIGSGGGLSLYESEPAYQAGVQSTGMRTTPDVSFDADPNTGAWIADTWNLGTTDPWESVGGTSLAAPAWAGLIALADQGRLAAGNATLESSGTFTAQTALYDLSQGDYHAMTSGFNGYQATPGYNLVAGLGSPIANVLITDLAAWSGYVNNPEAVAPLQAAGLVYTPTGGWSGGPGNVFQVVADASGRAGPSGCGVPGVAAPVPAVVASPTAVATGPSETWFASGWVGSASPKDAPGGPREVRGVVTANLSDLLTLRQAASGSTVALDALWTQVGAVSTEGTDDHVGGSGEFDFRSAGLLASDPSSVHPWNHQPSQGPGGNSLEASPAMAQEAGATLVEAVAETDATTVGPGEASGKLVGGWLAPLVWFRAWMRGRTRKAGADCRERKPCERENHPDQDSNPERPR